MDSTQPAVAVVAEAASPFVEAITRLAGLAGFAIVAVCDAVALARAWRLCAAIVIDAGSSRLVPDGLPRRDAVALVARTSDDASAWRLAVRLGASEVFVLGADDDAVLQWLVLRREPSRPRGRVVGVVGTCGGAGASTFAAALAVAAADTRTVMLIDGDRLGGGVDLLLGAEQIDGRRWPQLAAARGLVPADALRAALPELAGVALLSWSSDLSPPVSLDVAESVTAAAARGSDLVVVDIARPPDPFATALINRCDVVLAVVPASVRGVVAASAVIDAVAPPPADVRLVVRHPGPADVSIDAVVDRLRRPVLAIVGDDAKIAAACDRGELVRALRRSPVGSAARAALPALFDRDEREAIA